VDTKPVKALEAKRAALRQENAALVERLREKLTREMQKVRTREERDVQISIAR
jgi:hypothetical protein